MTVISVERFVAIVFPLRGKISLKMALVLITCSWLVSFGSALPYIFVMEQTELQFKNRKEIECKEAWPEYYTEDCSKEKTEKKIYYTLLVIVMYFVPVIVMFVTYTVIVIKLIFRKAPGGRTSEAQERVRKKVSKEFWTVTFWEPSQRWQCLELCLLWV